MGSETKQTRAQSSPLGDGMRWGGAVENKLATQSSIRAQWCGNPARKEGASAVA
ncbi:hypothetical protein BH11PSE12_BH11PSE12_23630 [soil metagenome]